MRKTDGRRQAARRGRVGRHDHVVGIDAVAARAAAGEAAARRSDVSHAVQLLVERDAARPSARACRAGPARRRCSITSGTPPARNTCTVG